MSPISDRNGRVTREGPFWDVMEGRAAPPPAAVLLGWELIAVDPEAGAIEVAFTASEQFLNPAGVIQGGFLAAMLDDTLGPARPGRLTGRGRIVRRGDSPGPRRITSGRDARPRRTAAGQACGPASAAGRQGSRAR
jgi:acyl-coenzyme A thioesterase PaaI-like protein